ncbi:conjugal transfer protein TraG N-terminal domain-containing protein [Pukyongiella litopenaei]|uniref:TraG N-terminal Proteobacteria domain-containing protein n=1 Tax=Pukyongiella litopenaei TaxID=2605946 RepID=A0A5C2H7T0_9RHOB|nr:conjugal transfer protein TraG N-terminal domain-containing protein [Pukyongiella litopenaei]QEP30421.1 hypothetical protein C6Y53_19585 [Pukyongiella litopenaei]
MPTLEVYTVGGGYFLYDIFNYLAAFTGSGNFKALLSAAITAGVLVAAFQMAVFGSARQVLTYFIGVMIVSAICVGPKARVVIHDSTVPLGIYGMVDNVPWSVAFVGSQTSKAGHLITKKMETLLAAPDDLAYQSSGMMFGATILSQASRWRAVSPVIQETLVNFMENCFVDGSNIGIVNTGELAQAGNLSSYIGANLPQALAFYDPVLDQVRTCGSGWPQVRQRLNAEVQNILYQKAAANSVGTPATNLPAAVAKMTNTLSDFQTFVGMTSSSAANTIRQAMLVLSMDDAVQHLIAGSGNNAAMTAYQAARTEAQTSASYSAVGISALKWVPLLKIVFESIYYAAFPLALLMMMTPLVWTVMKGYFGGFVWLAAWDPLSAILHSIVLKAASGYYREAMGSYNGASIDYALTFANHLSVRAVEQDVGTVAGYLMMSVPFLATGIMFGAGRVAGLATSMLNVSQGAAIESGREAATGNIQLANASMSNFAANKWNTSGLYDAGLHTHRMPGGAMAHRNPDGSRTISTGTGQSSGGMSARIGQTIREEVSDRKESAIRTANAAREEMTSGLNELSASYADFGRQLSTGSTAASDVATTRGMRNAEEARNTHQAVEDFAKSNGISVNSAYRIALAGKPELFGIGAGLTAEMAGHDQDSFTQLTKAARESGLSDSVAKYADTVDSWRTSEQSSQSSSESGGNRWSLEDLQRSAEAWSQAREEADTLASAESKLYAQGISYDGQLTDAISNEWREAGLSEEQIEGLISPKSIAGVKRQEQAVEQVLPQLLQELGLTTPEGDTSAAYTITRPEQDISTQPLPSAGPEHRARMGRHKQVHENVSAIQQGAFDAGKEQAINAASSTENTVRENRDGGVVPMMAGKVGDTKAAIGDGLSNFWNGSANGLSNYDRDVMIRTIYGEAANQGELGQAAVAHTIMNRVADPRWGDNPAEVSLQLKQFSAWNSGTGGNAMPMTLDESDPAYERIGAIVDGVAAGRIADPTDGATHYYSPQGMAAHIAAGEQDNPVPTWLAQQSRERDSENIRIGGHVFTGRKRDG